MLELLFAFGAGAVASSWIHHKSKKRAKSREAKAVVLNPPNLSKAPLSGAARAAVVLMTFPPELSAKVFSELGPEQVQRITLEITQLPEVSSALRHRVLTEFCASVGIAPDRLQEAASEEPALIAKALRLLCELTPGISA